MARPAPTHRLVDADTGRVLFKNLAVADTFISRAIGLLGRTSLDDDQALWIRPCTSIHMFGMRMPLNVAFCDKDGRVLRVAEHVRPWRVRFGPRGSRTALEWSPDAGMRVQVGQRLSAVEAA